VLFVSKMSFRIKNFFSIVFFIMLFPLAAICQVSPSVPKWVDDMGGTGSSISSFMKLDAQNNSYITGYFSGTVDFDPSPAVKNLTSINGSIDVFIAKYDTNGALIWVVSLGGNGTDTPNGLDFDSNGNITITGQYFSPTMDADPGPGVFNLTNAGGSDTFIVHVDGNGNFLWAKTIGGSGTDFGSKVANDHENNVLIASEFQSTVSVNGTNYTAKGNIDGLITKYDATGNIVWAFDLGAAGGGDNSTIGVIVDNNDNITITGYLNGNVNFNPLGAAFNVNQLNSTYIAQYTSTGILLWVKIITGSATSYGTNICFDAQNNIYVEGVFSSALNFNGSTTLNSIGTRDVFFAKYSTNGTFQWAKNVGGVGSSITNYGIAASSDNNLYISGYFSGNIDFDPSPTATAYVKDHGLQDLFLAKYDANGNYQWAFGAGNSGCSNTLARYVAVDSNNDVILTGSFCSTVNFDVSGCTTYNLTAQSSNRDFFLAKYVPGVASLTNDVITAPAITSFCGPSDPGIITGSTPTGGNGTYAYQWQESIDGITYGNLTAATAKDYDPPNLLNTFYFRRIVTSGNCLTALISNTVLITISTNLTNNVITTPAITGFCGSGDPANISGSVPSGSNGPFNYQWQSSIDNVTFTDIAGATSISYDPPVINATTYYRRIVTSGNCTAPVYSNIVTITVYPVVVNNVITAPAVTSFCGSGDPAIITGTTPSGGTSTYTYQWQSSTDNINFTNIAGATSISYDPSVINATTYYRRTVTSGICNGPVNSNIVTFAVSGSLVVFSMPADTICLGKSVILNAFGGPFTYQWSPALGLSNTNTANPTASPVVTTTYTVLVSNGSCSENVPVTIYVIPKPTVDAGADQTILSGDKAQLNGTVTGSNLQYRWSPVTYLDDPNILNPVASPPSDITYTLTVTSALGCFMVSDDVSIKVSAKIVVPNTFTPNGDGVNDTWDVAALATYPNCLVSVFTRTGVLVFKTVGYSKPWDGKYKGKLVPFGIYYYAIDLKDGTKPLTGWLSIIK